VQHWFNHKIVSISVGYNRKFSMKATMQKAVSFFLLYFSTI